MKNLGDKGSLAHAVLLSLTDQSVDRARPKGVTRIRKTSRDLVVDPVAALSAPVAADHFAGLVVTNPTTLVVLGAALINLGVWTRRLFSRQKRER